jgi:hypothetical protein
MGYRKLVDKEDFFTDVPGPAKDNNSREKSIGGQVEVSQVPGDGQGGGKGETPDGDDGKRHGSPVRYP